MMADKATHVVDANIVLAWSLDRPYSQKAVEFLRADAFYLVAPDLIVHEVGSALSYYVRTSVLTLEQAEDAYVHVTTFVELISAVSLRFEALSLSVSTGHSIYDCFYLALARQTGRPCVSADRKLASIAEASRIEMILLT
ncbi:MAG: type II toxin-antitoxin system VapC family toxin [Pseudomonadota bacterium]|nr:type II toxin-antitoxin system VapC family toxin [Pseudomonadota bacterium]